MAPVGGDVRSYKGYPKPSDAAAESVDPDAAAESVDLDAAAGTEQEPFDRRAPIGMFEAYRHLNPADQSAVRRTTATGASVGGLVGGFLGVGPAGETAGAVVGGAVGAAAATLFMSPAAKRKARHERRRREIEQQTHLAGVQKKASKGRKTGRAKTSRTDPRGFIGVPYANLSPF